MTEEIDDAGESDWDEDAAGSEDADDTPSGTDADFSGDTTTSLPVSDDADTRFEDLAENALSNAELAAFLAGDRKALLVHKSHQYAQSLNEVVGYARNQVKDGCSIGLVVPFRQSGDAVRAFMGRFPNTAVRFADPEIHLHPDQYDAVSDTTAGHWAHFTNPVPDPPDKVWSQMLLTEQLRCGATVLLSPTGKVEEANASGSLNDAMDRISMARNIVGEAPLFANLTFDHRWLSQRGLRDRLLDEIVDSSEQHWYLRLSRRCTWKWWRG